MEQRGYSVQWRETMAAEYKKRFVKLVQEFNPNPPTGPQSAARPIARVSPSASALESFIDDDDHPAAKRQKIGTGDPVTDEIDKYLADDCVRMDREIHKWWAANTSYPLIRKAAHAMLAMQATSVPSESLFSLCNRAMDKVRNRSHAETLERRVLVTTWSRAHLGILLDTDFGAHLQKLTVEFMCKDKLSHFDWSLGDLPDPSTVPLGTAAMDESRSDSGNKDGEQGGGADASETGEMDVEGQEGLGQESGEGEGDEGAAGEKSRQPQEPEWVDLEDDDNVGSDVDAVDDVGECGAWEWEWAQSYND